MKLVGWLVSLENVYSKYMPVSVAVRSKACTVYNRLNIEIAGLNPAQGMDMCLRVSVLCWTDPPTKESYQMSVDQEIR
jgi:hypothetical protein